MAVAWNAPGARENCATPRRCSSRKGRGSTACAATTSSARRGSTPTTASPSACAGWARWRAAATASPTRPSASSTRRPAGGASRTSTARSSPWSTGGRARKVRILFSCMYYLCRMIQLFSAPVIVSPPKDSYGPLGANLTLDCEARGHPAPEISWRFVSAKGETIALPSI